MGLKDKINEVLDKTTIDDKIIDAAGTVKDKVGDLLDKTEVDDKIKDAFSNLKDKITGNDSDEGKEA